MLLRNTAIKILLLLLSIFLLVASPVISGFNANTRHDHVTYIGHKHNVSHAHTHINTWNIISHRQLITPPPVIKIKNLVLIAIALGFLCFVLNFRLSKARVWLSKNTTYAFINYRLYLFKSVLLI
ncbi:hypothetical protein [Mucilaginibacter sp. KACC 22063]|uniref:hypothetical protein n=1 Tax=Mucilaginibacter sp. KACC 22063 TaxID=3025666 RepID=UPI0023670A15|nr:hypothetical protein [Mucilaginibacter sp. KACC 22063]WDF55421.1 hypothetical protein PQ461_21045 [Mucilaginibacter sp. KACC 22063]